MTSPSHLCCCIPACDSKCDTQLFQTFSHISKCLTGPHFFLLLFSPSICSYYISSRYVRCNIWMIIDLLVNKLVIGQRYYMLLNPLTTSPTISFYNSSFRDCTVSSIKHVYAVSDGSRCIYTGCRTTGRFEPLIKNKKSPPISDMSIPK